MKVFLMISGIVFWIMLIAYVVGIILILRYDKKLGRKTTDRQLKQQ